MSKEWLRPYIFSRAEVKRARRLWLLNARQFYINIKVWKVYPCSRIAFDKMIPFTQVASETLFKIGAESLSVCYPEKKGVGSLCQDIGKLCCLPFLMPKVLVAPCP